jgi:hypothetical protein
MQCLVPFIATIIFHPTLRHCKGVLSSNRTSCLILRVANCGPQPGVQPHKPWLICNHSMRIPALGTSRQAISQFLIVQQTRLGKVPDLSPGLFVVTSIGRLYRSLQHTKGPVMDHVGLYYSVVGRYASLSGDRKG